MRAIKKLAELMQEEVDDAEKYARLYQYTQDDDEELAETYKRLSLEELRHCDLLHEQAARLIKANKAPVPAGMMELWNWQHERIIDAYNDVKREIV